MKKINLIIICSLLFFNNLLAFDTLSVRYFPLHVGDFWIYNVHSFGWYGFDTTYKTKAIVTGSTIRENKLYFILINSPLGYNNNLLRTDINSGSLHGFDSLNTCNYYFKEKLVDTLSANVGDSLFYCHNYSFIWCSTIDTTTIFGYSKIRKKFSYYFHIGISDYYKDYRFNLDFGLTNYISSSVGYGQMTSSYILTGCKINGIVYGDTSSTFISNESNELPIKFKLYQNYPNPFNPVTSIKFEIPKTSVVTLKVFDVTGKEISTLINEKLNPGTYETQWNANEYSSGIYFYRLETNGYRETKRMILIK